MYKYRPTKQCARKGCEGRINKSVKGRIYCSDKCRWPNREK